MSYNYLYVPGEAVDGTQEALADMIEQSPGWRTHQKDEALTVVDPVRGQISPTQVTTVKSELQNTSIQVMAPPTMQDILPAAKPSTKKGKGFGGPLGIWPFPVMSRFLGPTWEKVTDSSKNTGTVPNLRTATLILNKDTPPFHLGIDKPFTATITVVKLDTGETVESLDEYNSAPSELHWSKALAEAFGMVNVEAQLTITEIGEQN